MNLKTRTAAVVTGAVVVGGLGMVPVFAAGTARPAAPVRTAVHAAAESPRDTNGLAPVDRASIDRVSADRPSTESVSLDRMSIDTGTSDIRTQDPASRDAATKDSMSKDSASTHATVRGTGSLDRNSTDRPVKDG